MSPWTTVTRMLSFDGIVQTELGPGYAPRPLKNVLVDVYRAQRRADGTYQTDRLNAVTVRTDLAGAFHFANLPVIVQTQMVIPATPPYTPFEITNPHSLPTLLFNILVDSEVVEGAVVQGAQYVLVYDERPEVSDAWLAATPGRVEVPLAGSPPITVAVPPEVALPLGLIGTGGVVLFPGTQVHLLRVGRAIRAEIGELGDVRPEFDNKPGYMRSTDTWAVPLPDPSFFPGVIDAPFGATLQVGGYFGATFHGPLIGPNLYYSVSFRRYDPAFLDNPYDPAHLQGPTTLIEDPLFNKKYILPTVALPDGQWQTMHLGPYAGTITAVEPPLPAAGVVGSAVKVYKWAGDPDPLTEYWPFPDLLLIWNSTAAANELIVLNIQPFEKTGEDPAGLQLRKLVMDPLSKPHLPLHIDNRAPHLKVSNWRTGQATFAPGEALGAEFPIGPCGDVAVGAGTAVDNKGILVHYSIEDGAGLLHPHAGGYHLQVDFSPYQAPGAPTETSVPLRDFGTTLIPPRQVHHGSYSAVAGGSAEWSVMNFESVLVPLAVQGWPSQAAGDAWGHCLQYAVEAGLWAWVRTVDGWGRIFGTAHVGRHFIMHV